MAKIYTESALIHMTNAALATLYNEYAEKPVKKFADHATAVKRTLAVLPEAPSSKKSSNEDRRFSNERVLIITSVKPNPKRGASAERYALYKNGMTVDEYIQAGGRLKDVHWDASREFIALVSA